jgi:hypothetical protein
MALSSIPPIGYALSEETARSQEGPMAKQRPVEDHDVARPRVEHPKVEDPAIEDPPIEESIEINGVPLVVWAVRLTLFLLVQGMIVLAAYGYYGFGTEQSHFGPGFRLDPIHAGVNLVWGLVGSVIGFFMPRYAITFALAFAAFYTLFAGFGTFTADHFGMRLDYVDNALNWLLAVIAWAIGIYALWQASLRADQPGA